MNKIKTFFRTFVKSISDPEYYKDILKAKFSFSLKYLFLFLFLVSLISGIRLASLVSLQIPKIPDFTKQAKTTLLDFYPRELMVTIENGKLKTNVKEPYFIPFPITYFTETGKSYDHFVTINTKAKESDYQQYKTLILVTSESVVTPDSNSSSRNLGAYKVYPLSEVEEKVVIDKKAYDMVIAKVLPYFDYLPTLAYVVVVLSVLVVPVIITLLDLLGKLIYLALFGIITFVVAKLMKKDLSYGKTYQLSMHAMTLPILITLIVEVVGVVLPAFGFSAILLILMVFIFTKLPSRG